MFAEAYERVSESLGQISKPIAMTMIDRILQLAP